MRKMAALCQAVGSFLRPVAASSSAGASRPGRGVTRSLTGLAAPRGPAQRSYGDQVHSVGFPPVPPPGVALDRRGASAVPARAYADDYGGGTMNQAPGYGGGTMNQAGSPAPPTVEWDPRNANTVTVIGNTGMDPEMTMFDTGACVARVSLAVRGKKPMSPGGMDPAGANNADDGATTWLDVEAWNDEARQLCDHVAKGRQIMVTGRLKENVWTDKATGQRRSRIKVSAYSFAFVAPYNGANGVNGGGVKGGAYRPDDPYANQAVAATMPPPQQQQQRMQQQRQASATMMGGDVVGEKDDLWREVLDNPDAWWDNRERKNAPGGNPRYPDFKHKDTQTPLWIESRDTPRWAIDALVGGGGGGGAPMAAGVGAGQPGSDADGFEPYYAGGGSVPGGGGGYGDLAGAPSGGGVDYSRPYGDVAYEPAKPFDDDEPPF